MLERLIGLYVCVFARSRFERFNKLLFRLSLGGLGILNYKTPLVSGERAFLKEYLVGKQGILVDVGANKGDYTREALAVNPCLKAYLFEPHPRTFARLSENLTGCDNVVLSNKGLSSAPGALQLYDYSDNDGSSHASLFEDVITEIHGSPEAIAHSVDVITLDDFVERERISEICLLKIDTEGNELEVLRGARKTIASGKIKAIHFEFNEMNVVSRRFFIDFWRLLSGFDFYRLLPNEKMAIKSYSPLSCEMFAYQNIVAIYRTDKI